MTFSKGSNIQRLCFLSAGVACANLFMVGDEAGPGQFSSPMGLGLLPGVGLGVYGVLGRALGPLGDPREGQVWRVRL